MSLEEYGRRWPDLPFLKDERRQMKDYENHALRVTRGKGLTSLLLKQRREMMKPSELGEAKA